MQSGNEVVFKEEYINGRLVLSISPIIVPKPGYLDESNRYSLLRPMDIGQLYDDGPSATPWIWDGYLVRGGITLLAGAPKLGKTTLTYQAMASIATGVPFLSRSTTQSNILLLGLEEHRRDITQRLLDNSTEDLSGRVKIEFGPLPFDGAALGEIVRYIEENEIGLVVIDTLPMWWNLTDEKDAAEVLRKGSLLLRAVRNSNAAWLGLLHTRKGGGMHGEEIRGSSALPGLADIAVSMKRTTTGNAQRVLDAISRHSETPRELIIEFKDELYVAVGTPDEASAAAKDQRVFDLLTDEFQTSLQLMKASGLSKQDISRSMERLGGAAERNGKGHRGDPYGYRRNSISPASMPKEPRVDESNGQQSETYSTVSEGSRSLLSGAEASAPEGGG